MGEPKHTPGPWRTHPVDDTMVIDATGSEVAAIDGDYNDPDTWPLMEANARLIAAAPELLALARKASKVLGASFNRIHPLPRTSDTELADAIEEVRGHIKEIVAKINGGPDAH